MQNIFLTELKRAFLNKRFMLVFILAGLSFAYGFFQIHSSQEFSPVGAFTAWQEILYAGYYGFFAAATAVLPFADSLSRDKNEHILDSILVRTSYGRYLRAKTAAVLLSGAAAVLLPAVMLLGFCYLIYPAEPNHVLGIYFNFSEIYTRYLIQPGLHLNPSLGSYAALSLLFLGLFGAAYALLGMGISFLTRSSVIALGIPFMCYSFGYYGIPTSRHLNWMRSTEAVLTPEGNLLSPILQLSLIALFFLLSSRLFGKKEQQVLQ